MNRQEAAQIVAYLNRAGLVGAMEGQAAVWADSLENVSFTTAQEVVRGMTRTRTSAQRWVTPGDVSAEVARIRKARTSEMRSPEPPASIDPDSPTDQIAWIRTYVAAIGDGHDEAEADRIACERVGVVRPDAIEAPHPVPALVKQIARALPRIPTERTAR